VKKTGLSDKQIIAVLREQEGGMSAADLCRKHGISSATLYVCKTMYGGLEPWQPRPPLVGRLSSMLGSCSASASVGPVPASAWTARRCATRPGVVMMATCGRGCAR
jgi:hypothetical protein